MTKPKASPIYLATCPAWCNQKHPILVGAYNDPIADELEAQPLVVHETRLVEANRLIISLTQDQQLTHNELIDHPKNLSLYVDGNPAANELTPKALRAWATVLNLAADLAEEVTQWR